MNKSYYWEGCDLAGWTRPAPPSPPPSPPPPPPTPPVQHTDLTGSWRQADNTVSAIVQAHTGGNVTIVNRAHKWDITGRIDVATRTLSAVFGGQKLLGAVGLWYNNISWSNHKLWSRIQ